MSRDLRHMDARGVIEALGLGYLTGEGCWVSLIWRTEDASAIYALITPEDFSAMHRLDEDEAWTYIAGDPAEIVVLHPDGSHQLVTLGIDIAAGQVPHFRVPRGCWQGTLTLGQWTLVSCVLVPPFTKFELATEATDLELWSDAQPAIAARMR